MPATEPCVFDLDESQWPALHLAVVDPDGRLLDLDHPLDHDLVDRFVGQMCQFEDETSDLWWDSLHNVLLALGLHRYIHYDIEPPDSKNMEDVDRWHRERAVVCELLAGSACTLLLDLAVEAGYDASNPKFKNPFHLCELLRGQMRPSLASARQIHQHVQALRPDQFEDVSDYLHELDRLYTRLDYHGVGRDNPVWAWHCLDALDRADPQWRRKLALLETTRERQRESSKKRKEAMKNSRNRGKATLQGSDAPSDEGPAAGSQHPSAAASSNGEGKSEQAEDGWESFHSWDELFAALKSKTRKLKLSGPERKKTRPGSRGVQAGHGQGGQGREKSTVRAGTERASTNQPADNSAGHGGPKGQENIRGDGALPGQAAHKEPAPVRAKGKKGKLPKTDPMPKADPVPETVGLYPFVFTKPPYNMLNELEEDYDLVADCDLGDEDEDDNGGGYLGLGGSVATVAGHEDALVVINGERRRVIPGYAARKKKTSHALRDASKPVQQHFFRSKFPGRPRCATCTCQHPAVAYAYCAVCDFCHVGGQSECWILHPHLRGTRPLREKYHDQPPLSLPLRMAA